MGECSELWARPSRVKGLTIIDNSISNGWRMEGVWLDK
jgi:hypothetical protein